MANFRCLLWISLAVILSQPNPNKAAASPPHRVVLVPGEPVPAVRAITCNTYEQLVSILVAYSQSYQDGQAAFEKQRHLKAFDEAAGQMAPACDEVWFKAVIPIRTMSKQPYNVRFADGSLHQRYAIEARPVGPSGVPSSVSYFISSRWRVLSLETAL